MQKRLISMVLALSMALTAMPLPALAQSAPPDTASAAALAEENGGTVENSQNTLKLPVENTAGYDGNAEPYQPIIDGGECTVVYNEGGIIQNNPIIHALVAKDTEDLNGATDYYTLNYTAPEGAEYAKKYINGINGMMEGVWDAETSTLYVDTDLNTISVITHAPIKSVNGVAYSGSVADGERYNSTIDLRKYNIPQTHILNLSATGEGAAELPPADPADFAFVLPNNLTYDGSPKEVTVKNTSNKDYGDVTVTYMQNGKVLDGAPIEPGDYSYTVTVAGSAQYAGGTVKTGSFRIIAETRRSRQSSRRRGTAPSSARCKRWPS